MRDVTLVWFRQDLRLSDNPAMAAAVARGRPILCLYILDDAAAPDEVLGGASRWWLHHSLAALEQALHGRGQALALMRGAPEALLPRLIDELQVGALYWNRVYEPAARARDERLKRAFKDRGIDARSFNAALLIEPFEVATKQGAPFKVFTPFWKAAQTMIAPVPAQALPDTVPPAPAFTGVKLDALKLLPSWRHDFGAYWQPGEVSARAKLDRFVDEALDGYGTNRDRMDLAGTSKLSPHLHFGEIGPGQVWRALTHAHPPGRDRDKFLAELGWREFAHHLLFHFPHLPQANFNPAFDAFPWRADDAALRAWHKGLTGYPIVDAAMRELWTTGWMHNRARMIVASFLVKHLLIPWREGAAWFWDTLLDADLANNAASWQWVAGSGADAAPYFRVFNPILQGQKFDPDGTYVRRYVPELSHVPTAVIHQPWLDQAKPKAYPAPIIAHDVARQRALSAFATLSRGTAA